MCGLELLGLLYAGLFFGGYSVYLGIKGLSSKRIPVTKRRAITGQPAEWVGLACIALGIALIAFTMYHAPALDK